VRALAVIGALLFAYLALIPALLVGATVDPGCESGCEFAMPITVYLVIAFGACALALLGSAAGFAAYAARPSRASVRLLGRSLRLSALTVAILLLSEFALGYPVAAAVIAVVSLLGGWMITRPRRGW
jgi:hypothetical protein